MDKNVVSEVVIEGLIAEGMEKDWPYSKTAAAIHALQLRPRLDAGAIAREWLARVIAGAIAEDGSGCYMVPSLSRARTLADAIIDELEAGHD